MEKTKKEIIDTPMARLQRERRKEFIERMKGRGITVNDNIRGIYYSLLVERR
jgi:hypothetical protein